MELAQPAWLGLAVLVPAWLALAWRRGSGAAPREVLRLPGLAPAAWQATPGQRAPLLLQGAALLLLLVALAQPRTSGDWIRPPPLGRDLALVLDTSLTMSLADYELQGQPVARLAVLKQLLSEFVAARPHDRFSLLVFGSEAALLTPPTHDGEHVRAQLQRLQVGMAGENTALGDALGLALRPLQQGQLRPAVILVSDGEPSNSGALSPGEAVAVARAQGVAIHTLQVGAAGRAATATGAAPEAQPGLPAIARLTGGRHWQVRSSADLREVLQAIDRLEPTLAQPARARVVHEWYAVPLGLALACLAAAGWLRIRRGGAA